MQLLSMTTTAICAILRGSGKDGLNVGDGNTAQHSPSPVLDIHLSSDLSIHLPIPVHLARGYGSLIVYQRVAAHLLLEIGPN